MNGTEDVTNRPASTPGSYWSDTKRPIVCLAFVAPMLLIYELGVFLPGADAARNGVDACLRYLLDFIGFGQYFLLPLVTGGILLAWQHASGRPWKFDVRVLGGMAVESLIFALVLLLAARMLGSSFVSNSTALLCEAEAADTQPTGLARAIGFFGAGIYEELFFRLMLLPATVALLRTVGLSNFASALVAIAVTSLVFSAAHHIAGEQFQVYTFVFRFLAGAYFALLLLGRGFGIAVGAHAVYDILAYFL